MIPGAPMIPAPFKPRGERTPRGAAPKRPLATRLLATTPLARIGPAPNTPAPMTLLSAVMAPGIATTEELFTAAGAISPALRIPGATIPDPIQVARTAATAAQKSKT